MITSINCNWHSSISMQSWPRPISKERKFHLPFITVSRVWYRHNSSAVNNIVRQWPQSLSIMLLCGYWQTHKLSCAKAPEWIVMLYSCTRLVHLLENNLSKFFLTLQQSINTSSKPIMQTTDIIDTSVNASKINSIFIPIFKLNVWEANKISARFLPTWISQWITLD